MCRFLESENVMMALSISVIIFSTTTFERTFRLGCYIWAPIAIIYCDRTRYYTVHLVHSCFNPLRDAIGSASSLTIVNHHYLMLQTDKFRFR